MTFLWSHPLLEGPPKFPTRCEPATTPLPLFLTVRHPSPCTHTVLRRVTAPRKPPFRAIR